MGAKALGKEINHYLELLSPAQKKAVLTVVKTFAQEEGYDHWKDPSFVEEMETRYNDLKTGKDKGVTLEQLEEGAKSRIKWTEMEIERRFKDLESGKVKGISFEQLAEGARKAYRNKKSNSLSR